LIFNEYLFNGGVKGEQLYDAINVHFIFAVDNSSASSPGFEGAIMKWVKFAMKVNKPLTVTLPGMGCGFEGCYEANRGDFLEPAALLARENSITNLLMGQLNLVGMGVFDLSSAHWFVPCKSVYLEGSNRFDSAEMDAHAELIDEVQNAELPGNDTHLVRYRRGMIPRSISRDPHPVLNEDSNYIALLSFTINDVKGKKTLCDRKLICDPKCPAADEPIGDNRLYTAAPPTSAPGVPRSSSIRCDISLMLVLSIVLSSLLAFA
jgi:hypothetical protein